MLRDVLDGEDGLIRIQEKIRQYTKEKEAAEKDKQKLEQMLDQLEQMAVKNANELEQAIKQAGEKK